MTDVRYVCVVLICILRQFILHMFVSWQISRMFVWIGVIVRFCAFVFAFARALNGLLFALVFRNVLCFVRIVRNAVLC